MSVVQSIVIVRESNADHGKFVLMVDHHTIAEISYRDYNHRLRYLSSSDAYSALEQIAERLQDNGLPEIDVRN